MRDFIKNSILNVKEKMEKGNKEISNFKFEHKCDKGDSIFFGGEIKNWETNVYVARIDTNGRKRGFDLKCIPLNDLYTNDCIDALVCISKRHCII